MADKIEALIFDLDGVLVNTIDLHFHAWKRIADEAGVPFDRRDMDGLRGLQRQESLQRILGDTVVDHAQWVRYSDRKDTYYNDVLQTVTPDDLLMPGAEALIRAAREAGLKVGVASASLNAIPTLQRVGLFPLLDAVADGSTVPNSKPAPDIFIWVAGALRVRPVQAIVFEDATAGVQAARAAGMKVIGLGLPHLVSAADRIFAGLHEVRLDDLLRDVLHV
ncbi:MAG: beta-phosphoglucomutase [Anaerolineae bacterium]